MGLKTAIVFIAGGLTGSGIVTLTNPPGIKRANVVTEVVAPIADAQVTIDSATAWVDFPQTVDQHAYVHARFAVQRPFAALHPVQRQP